MRKINFILAIVAVLFSACNSNVVKVRGEVEGLKGKVKLLDFWASWCHPCRELNPELIALYEKYHDKGLEIVGISLDNDKDAWVKAIRDDKLPWLQGSDLGDGFRSPTAQLYGVFSVPASYLLDENNRIVAKYLRGEALERKVAEMLGE